jgi:hypothetical protein
MRGDLVEALRFSLELGQLDVTSAAAEGNTEFLAALDRATSGYLASRRRNIDESNLGVDDVEAFLQQPVHRFQTEVKPYDEELALISRLEDANQLMVGRDIVEYLRNEIFEYLMQCETELRFSTIGSDAYERHRERVDRMLATVAPDVLAMISAARDRANDGGPEERSQALSSCRRVLETLADHVFPARDTPHTDSKGEERPVGQQQYRNRIVAALQTSPTSTLSSALAAGVEDFANRLDRLDALTQKGVHDHPTTEDVDFGVVQTYLLAGEVLAACASD